MTGPEALPHESAQKPPRVLSQSPDGTVIDMGDGNIGIIGKNVTAELDPEIAQIPGTGRGRHEQIVAIGRHVLDEAFGTNTNLDPAADHSQEPL